MSGPTAAGDIQLPGGLRMLALATQIWGVSINGGTPKKMVYKRKSQSKMDDSGVSPYR